MRRHFIIFGIVALAAGPALAQATNNVGNPAIKDSAPHTTTSATKGRNSFTEKQAIHRLAKAGYSASSLTKDADGVWTGPATKAGKSVTVGLDFKGNITER
ncbi:hypothetical protein [Polymorphobacter megasporae]|uniref:hypothetical protein n=1 Tax=Glacieibacterium megasporae TaxID=2835787 RepID=UPI001C1E4EB7|nr:hypothetical protein [Polymorphobacter megasporae]UAJ08897.1 hypothetical protein KTC28_10965 [Polymorphobacter megasporae]